MKSGCIAARSVDFIGYSASISTVDQGMLDEIEMSVACGVKVPDQRNITPAAANFKLEFLARLRKPP